MFAYYLTPCACLLRHAGVRSIFILCALNLKFSNILNELYLRMKIVTKLPVPIPTLPSHILNTKHVTFFSAENECVENVWMTKFQSSITSQCKCFVFEACSKHKTYLC